MQEKHEFDHIFAIFFLLYSGLILITKFATQEKLRFLYLHAKLERSMSFLLAHQMGLDLAIWALTRSWGLISSTVTFDHSNGASRLCFESWK